MDDNNDYDNESVYSDDDQSIYSGDAYDDEDLVNEEEKEIEQPKDEDIEDIEDIKVEEDLEKNDILLKEFEDDKIKKTNFKTNKLLTKYEESKCFTLLANMIDDGLIVPDGVDIGDGQSITIAINWINNNKVPPPNFTFIRVFLGVPVEFKYPGDFIFRSQVYTL